MTAGEMIDSVLATVNSPDESMIGNKRITILGFISDTQRDYATRTWRFEKRERTTSITTGGEEAQGKFTLASLHYEFLGLKAVQYDGYPLPIMSQKTYLGGVARNAGEVRYNTPAFAWIYGKALRVWPICNAALTLRIFYAAKPNRLTLEADVLVIDNTAAILADVRRKVYEVLKDNERAQTCMYEYQSHVKADNDRPKVMDEDFSPYVGEDDPNSYYDSFAGRLYQ